MSEKSRDRNPEFLEEKSFDFKTGIEKLSSLIREKSQSKDIVVILIEGKPNSGKTTIIKQFVEEFDDSVTSFVGIEKLSEIDYLKKVQDSKVLFIEEIGLDKNTANYNLNKQISREFDIVVYIYNPSISKLNVDNANDADIVMKNLDSKVKKI
jgi:AAA+ ATPase superfamily predicted ATPase